MSFNEELRVRTKSFSLRAIKLFRSLPRTDEASTLGKQFLRSACSVGANFRSASRSRSKAEYLSKISIACEEADESSFWLELLIESGIISESRLKLLLNESIEITKILSASIKTMKKNK